MISWKASAGHEGGGVHENNRIIIRVDLWILSITISNSQTEFEYVKHMS